MLPVLTGALWPQSAYIREQLPERVLQFGTGMLLRGLCVTAVDSANRAGARAGRIVVAQSTAQGAARAKALNTQDGLFTLVERGLSGGKPLERVSIIGAISRAVDSARDVAARPETRVIISNALVTVAEPYAFWAIEADPAELRAVSFRTRAVAEPALQGTGLALAAAAHLTFTRTSLESLGEAAHIPEFAAATTRWMAVLKRDGVEAALCS